MRVAPFRADNLKQQNYVLSRLIPRTCRLRHHVPDVGSGVSRDGHEGEILLFVTHLLQERRQTFDNGIVALLRPEWTQL